MNGCALFLALASADGDVTNVELVCLEHLDVGFTASPQEIARRQKLHLDHAIALCRECPDFRWTVESIWQLEEWLARTPEPAARAEFVALAKDGRIEVEGGFANLHTGAMDAELLLRCFEPADAIRRDLGVPITSCVQDDVPGFCALLPTAMRGSGLRYFLAGINTTFGGGTSLGLSKNPFWWEGLDGSRVLTWVAYGSYVEAEKLGLGVWSKDAESEQQLTAALAQFFAAGYRRPRILVMASTGDNGDPDAARSILRKVDAWNASHKHVRVSFTTPAAFLSSLERDAIAATGRADGGFPVARGDWSGHWEPVKNSAPAGLALFRDAEALLPGCEALSLRANRELGLPYPQHDLEVAFRKLLLCAEHSWPGGVGWPKLTTKAQVEATAQFDHALAFDAHETLHGIVDRLIEAYANQGGTRAINESSNWVANPVPFERDSTSAWSITNRGSYAFAPWDTLDAELFVLPSFASGLPAAALDSQAHHLRIAAAVLSPTTEGPVPITIEPTDGLPAAAFDPLRLLARARPFGGAPISSIRFTTAAGVIGPGDFLPGSIPRSFCSSGCVELVAPPQEDGRSLERWLGLREPYCFQVGIPGLLGDQPIDGASDIWIQLLDRPVRGETKDRADVAFPRLEPTTDPRLTFHLASLEVHPPKHAALDADLMRVAWDFRCPLIEREIDPPWFPSSRNRVGATALITTSHPNVLALQLRPSRGDVAAVILQLQEIGGLAVDDVEVTLSLEGLEVARPCDLLEQPTSDAPLLTRPLRISLRPHEVATFRLSRR